MSLEAPVRSTLKGAPARTAKNMDASLSMPTATSVRSLPVKLLIDQRVVINNHLRRARGGKVSYTHLIGYAMVQALKTHPEMNNGYEVVDGKPYLVVPAHVNLGLAIDLPKPDGTRQLLVPSIKSCETLNFAPVLGRVRADRQEGPGRAAHRGGLRRHHHHPDQPRHHRHQPLGSAADAGPGHDHRRRLDRLPAGVPGLRPATSSSTMSVSKVMTLTSTYDHRVIQGAQSGQYLQRLHALLLGEDGFYDDVFAALRIPYEPIRWAQDVSSRARGPDPQAGPDHGDDQRLPEFAAT